MSFCISSGFSFTSGWYSGPTPPYPVDYLVIAGGGSGGTTACGGGSGGGGGAGGVLEGCFTNLVGTPYTISVGAGAATASATNGQDSCLGCVATSCGGGRGAASGRYGACNGGSGGGATNPLGSLGGCGFPPQGNNGGCGGNDLHAGGGGAGRSGFGLCQPNSRAGQGGCGRFYCLTQAIQYGVSSGGCYWVGGGGGGSLSLGLPLSAGDGGLGGGGSGVTRQNGTASGQAGCAGTGGGGGGGYGGYPGGPSPDGGRAGGSGAVIIRHSATFPDATTTGSPCLYSCGGYKFYLFTGSGTISFN